MTDSNKRCAPNKVYTDDSCIPLEVLIDMAEAYNKLNKSNPIVIDYKQETLNPSILKRNLVKEFTERLKDKCKYDQICWTKQSFVKQMKRHTNELKLNTFRPTGPTGQFTWLSTLDIDKVMTQYETKYTDFKFLGAVPIDFDDLPQLGLKNINFDQYKSKGYTEFGVIFNLDEHYKSGSHWVATYMDLTKGNIYFSDSFAIPPEKRIRAFLRHAANYCQSKGLTNLDIRHNKTRHQRGNSECGVYSINFILRLLRGDTFDTVTAEPLADRVVNKCRNVYFNNPKIK